MKSLKHLEPLITQDYVNGINNKELVIKYDVSRGYIQSILKKQGIALRSASDVTKKYNVDENYFQEIDDQNKAYILGLIYADGNIYKNRVQLYLVESDLKILEQISALLCGDKNLIKKKAGGVCKFKNNSKTYYRKPQVGICVSRKTLINDLKKHGVQNNKTFKIRFPKLKNELYRHFIRGYFDGDGCFYNSLVYKNNNRIQITSNKFFIQQMKKFLQKELKLKIGVSLTATLNIQVLNIFGNNQVKIFLTWIYKQSNLKLERKFLKYKTAYCLI
jgi:hypothetical protein